MAPPSDERQPLIHSQYITNPFHDQEIEPVNTQPSNKHVRRPHVFASQSQYLSGDSFELMIYKESGEYRVMKDIYQGTMFTVKLFTKYSPNPLLVLLDPNETPVALLENVMSHDRWDVSAIRESILDLEKVFSASENHTAVNVSLEDQRSRFDHVDFQVKWLDKTCIIYKGDSSTVIAKNGNKLSVKVYPNMNYAFVVTIFVIIDAMKFTEESVCAPLTMTQPVSCSHVIGLKYSSEGLTSLLFEKTENSAAGEYSVSKAESRGERMFTTRSHNTTFHSQLKLLDEDGKRIAMLRKKNATGHSRWVVLRVDGENEASLKKVFSVCKSQMIQRHMDLNVIMGKGSSAADFKVTGSWTDKTCTISKGQGDSSRKVAQMRPLVYDEGKFKVDVYSNMDCAFVVTLIAIVDAMKSFSNLKVAAGRAADFAVKLAVGAACAAVAECV
ncbi:putative tubby-like protein [Helianthus annuus]|nr:putative tubby-like protein [Helianthus annuus]